MKYCTQCVLPDTRPNLRIEADGVCSACRAHEAEDAVDWQAREREWEQLVDTVKARHATYDVVLAASGGKDTFHQAKTCLDYGLKPLAVTWRPHARTELGQLNLEAFLDLGLDHIDVTTNPAVDKRLYRHSFEQLGSDAIMHLAVFSNVAKFAYLFKAPLVLWSENSATQYGSMDHALSGSDLTNAWVQVLGSTQGRGAADYQIPGLTARDLAGYWMPSDAELAHRRIQQKFLGYYFRWDAYAHYLVATRLGFEAAISEQERLTGYDLYSDLDDPFVGAHHRLKLAKFGFSRSQDNLSQHIRCGRMARPAALQHLRTHPDDTNYLALDALCEFVERDREWFYAIEDRFRNMAIWQRDDQGHYHIPEYVVPLESWNHIGQRPWK